MNLLIDGMNQGVVKKTNRITKMTVDGLTEDYPIYLVRLDYLYFNEKNDRIATWINKYEAENGVDCFNTCDTETYNQIIQKFITESNPDKLKQTQNNIGMIGQQKNGVVLKDGRIIDGNRRFSCLRNLASEDSKFNWFETVILDKDYEHNAKQIKLLELQIQIGEEEKVEYNPIDRLVGIYRDLIDENTRLLSVKEYAHSTNEKESQVKKMMEVSNLLVEFLDTINASGKYYLARDMDLNGPLHELHGILKKIKDDEKKELTKQIVFANFLMKPSGDMTRFIRNLKKVAESTYIDEFINKEEDIAEKVIDEIGNCKDINQEKINDIRSNNAIKTQLEETMDIISNKAKLEDTKNKPNHNLKKAINSLEMIDCKLISKLSEEQKADMIDNLVELDNLISNIKEALNV